ncbi:MAG: guanylate kinase [Planctomycetota bacterium]
MPEGIQASLSGLLVIVSGPAGVGKSTIVNAMVDRLDALLSISMTTRYMGPNDVDGQHYYFVSESEFKKLVKLGQMLEYAQVYDNYYGTPAEPVEKALAQGETVILEIDVQGANQVKQRMPGAVGILIEPPSDAVLLQRLRDRKREDEATIQKRFSRARDEIQLAKDLGIYQYAVVNDQLDRAIDRAVAIVETELGGEQGV